MNNIHIISQRMNLTKHLTIRNNNGDNYFMAFQNKKSAQICSEMLSNHNAIFREYPNLHIGINDIDKGVVLPVKHNDLFIDELCLDTFIDQSYMFQYNIFVCTTFSHYGHKTYINGVKMHNPGFVDSSSINFDLMKWYFEEISEPFDLSDDTIN